MSSMPVPLWVLTILQIFDCTLFPLKNASQILKLPSSAHPCRAGTTTVVRTHLFRYRTKRLSWTLLVTEVGGQEMAEMVRQAQGSHGTEKEDPGLAIHVLGSIGHSTASQSRDRIVQFCSALRWPHLECSVHFWALK